MDILPAIDLRDGKVVRLVRGDYDAQTTYGLDPAAVARTFAEAGVAWIHTVDLDAARSGRLTNTRAVGQICRAVAPGGVKVQCGGGIRDAAAVQALRQAGAARLVIGSAALKNWTWFDGLLAEAGVDSGALALGLDARGGRLAAEGWTERLAATPVELAARVRGSGLGAIVYTDIERDGTLTGVNVEATAEVIAATDVPVIASGGVRSLDDVRRCREAGCAGLIVGKAWYEGRIDLAEACRLANRALE